jgi:DNA-directed RNA polymerase beta subunit/intein/homing endonuclease
MRAFFNRDQITEETHTKVFSAVKSMFPFEGNKHKLVLNKIWADDKLSYNNIKGQYTAKTRGKSWAVPVYGDVSLIDKNTGKVIDRKQKIFILSLPKITQRYSYIVDGTEYQVPSQARLKPGIFVHQQADGVYRGWVKAKEGPRRDIKLFLDPGAKKFTMGYGTAKAIPLYSVFRKFGYTDDYIKDAWGEELYEANKKTNITLGLNALQRSMFGKVLPDQTEAMDNIREVLSGTTVDPTATEITTGKPISNISLDTLMSMSKKMIGVAQGSIKEDDPDSLVFKNIMTVDDFLSKRLPDSIRKIRGQIKNNLDRKDTVREILLPTIFTMPIKAFFKGSTGLATPAEHSSPLGFIAEHTKITPMGEGGITSTDQINIKSQAISPSHIGFLDPIFTPDNDKAGVVLHLSMLANKHGNDLRIQVYNRKTNMAKTLNSKELSEATIGFNNQFRFEANKPPRPIARAINAVKDWKIQKVSEKDVPYIFIKDSSLFSLPTNLIPFLQHNQGNRALYGVKMMQAALAMKSPEAPLVMSKLSPTTTTEGLIGTMMNHFAPVKGKVTSISDEEIKIKGGDNKTHTVFMYNDYPMGEDSFLKASPLVKVGDEVTEAQLVARTNFSDDKSNYSYGKNLNVAYMSYKGLNTDDGIVISESAAKKMTSEHLHTRKLRIDENTVLDLKKFRNLYPTSITELQANKLDSDGVIKKGQTVDPGDTVIAALRKETITMEDAVLKKVYKKIAIPLKNRAVTWEEDYVGTVVNVVKKGRDIKIYIKTSEPMVIADKLTSRHASKGVVVSIIPDKDMPRTKDGRTAEVIMSPAVVTTRMSVGQVLESGASKVAEKTGKPYLVNQFPNTGSEFDRVKADMKKHGVSLNESMIDPNTGREFKNVMFGKQYLLKLKQQARTKISARSGGITEPYNINRMAQGGGFSGGQAIGHLGLYAMLAHGAPHNLYEINTYKADENPEFWNALQLGQPLPAPKIPFAYDKFIAYLKALGINVERIGDSLHLNPLTDKDVMSLSNGEIDATKIIRGKDLMPEKGGLFDPVKTGYSPERPDSGERWTHITLNEVIPNPTFETAIMTLLDLTGKEYDLLIDGTMGVDDSGNIVAGGKHKFGKAFKKLLSGINVSRDLKKLETELKTAPITKVPALRKKVRTLRALKKAGMTPEQAYIRKKLGVIPPYFRSIIPLDSGGVSMDDLNGLYKSVAMYNNSLKQSKDILGLDDEIAQDYRGMYDAVKALQLTGSRSQNRQYRSVMDIVKGSRVKEGFLQKALLARRKQDLSGRSVIIPDPSLSLDELGVPKKMAWKVFEPFVIRRLVAQGYSPNESLDLIAKQSGVAEKALDNEVNNRLVMFKRDPVLHKFGILAMKPKLTSGTALKIHPLMSDAYGADFDGDCILSMISISYDSQKYKIREHSKEYLTQTPNSGMISTSHYLEDLNMFGNKTSINVGKIIHIKDFPRAGKPRVTNNKEIYKVPEGIFIHSYNNDTGMVEKAQITEFSIHKNLDLVRVKTRFNKEIVCSVDHSLFCIDDDFILRKMTPNEALGKLTPRPRILQSGNLEKIEVPKKILNKGKHILNSSIELNEHTGYVCGLLVGEGWSDANCRTRSTGVNFCNTSVGISEHTKKGLIDWFCPTLHFYTRTTHNEDFCDGKYASVKHTCTCRGLSELVNMWIGHGAANKHLPPFYMEACEDFRVGLLGGLLDGDGTVSIVKAKAKKNPQAQISYHTISEVLSKEVCFLATSLGIKASITPYKSSTKGTQAYNISFSCPDFSKYKGIIHLKHEKKRATLDKVFDWDWADNNAGISRTDIIPFNRRLGDIITSTYIKNKDNHNLYTEIRHAVKNPHITRRTANKILSIVGTDIHNLPFGTEFKSWVENDEIFWDVIKSVEPAPEEGTTAYDFTVPGSYTFMTADQVIVYDTMSVYAPITPAAQSELTRMLPSSNLFNPTNGKIVFYPTQEAQLGIYLMTKPGKKTSKAFTSLAEANKAYEQLKIKMDDQITIKNKATTLGRERINHILPKEHRVRTALDSKLLFKTLTTLAKTKPNEYASVIDGLKKEGFDYSYDSGFSLSLSDFEPAAEKKIDKVWRDAEKKVFGRDLSDQEIVDIFTKAKDDSDALLQQSLNKSDNALHTMTISGAKGKFLNLSQMIGSVGLVEDITGVVQPYPIKGNFSKGLEMSEYWSHMHGARKGAVYKQQEVKNPGYRTKKLVNSLLNQVVVEPDCGTRQGIMLRTDDIEALDRYTTENIRLSDETIKYGELVTPDLIQKLKKHKVRTLVVRSPIRCESAQGVCQKCVGIIETGRTPEIGSNQGVLATQAVGEPSVQLTLSMFHKGGVKEKTVSPLIRISQLTEPPIKLTGKATISSQYGKVQAIKPSAVGGYTVTINDKDHWVQRGNELKVKVGTQVKKGQALSTGPIDPRELMSLRGVKATQNYMIDELYDVMKPVGPVKRKHLELIIRAIANIGEITDAGDNENYIRGDLVPISKLDYINKYTRLKRMKPKQAVGMKLISKVPGISPGSMITEGMLNTIRFPLEIEVEGPKIKYKPVIRGASVMPREVIEDWMAKLNFDKIKSSLLTSAQFGAYSDIYGLNPIPSMVRGVDILKAHEKITGRG